jgi:methylmalonyl-CoA mutase
VLKVKPVPAKPYGKDKIKFNALEPIRLAVPFEALRDKSDHILARQGARPKVFLANLGTPADFTARAGFAKSFFETGGIEAVDNEGFTDPAALAEPFRASGAAVACLCSSDKLYPDHAAAAAKALSTAGAKHIYLAGKPGDLEPALREAGVQDFIFAGSDALALLVAAYGRME